MTADRRQFLKEAAAGAALTAAATYARADGANNRLTVGVIGPGGMGTHHLDALLGRDDVRIAFVCDADANRLAAAAKRVADKSKQAPKAVKDMREVLDQKDVDAVFIATPDHWHAPATILACDAGKHVYVEKPCCHNLREGRLMTEAARRAKRVVQTGTQSRSTRHVMDAMAALKSGIIGEVLVCRVWNSQLRRNIGKTKPSDPPKHLDYDLWVGPAPMTPYRSNMLPGIWRWWFDFGCGDFGNDGVHDIDIGRWGLGVQTHPSTIAAVGGKYFFDDDQQFPDTQTVIFEYPGDGKMGQRKQLIFEQRIWSPYVEEGHENGNAFYGTKGYMILGKGSGWQVFGPRNAPGQKATGKPDLPAHHQNFFECIRNGGTPNADVEIGHHSAALCHLGNIATRLGRTLHFDPANETIAGDSQANDMLRRKYRLGHWAVPKGV
jgi:predicted dehydrogenase